MSATAGSVGLQAQVVAVLDAGAGRRTRRSTTAMTTCPCAGVMARSTSTISPSSMPASRMASPATRIRKVACGLRMRMSLRSSRVTPESSAGEPKPMATLARAGAGCGRGSRPTRTTLPGDGRLLDVHPVSRADAGSISPLNAERRKVVLEELPLATRTGRLPVRLLRRSAARGGSCRRWSSAARRRTRCAAPACRAPAASRQKAKSASASAGPGSAPAVSDQEGLGHGQAQRVGARHHRHLGHRLVLDQRAFQLERADAVVGRLEHVVGAADEGDVAVGVAHRDVAGVVVAVAHRVGRLRARCPGSPPSGRAGAAPSVEADLALVGRLAVGVEQRDRGSPAAAGPCEPGFSGWPGELPICAVVSVWP